VLTRPLSAGRCSGRGSTPLILNAFSATTKPNEKALLVKRWQAVQWHVVTNVGASVISYRIAPHWHPPV
jgi:hypothetical protein